MQQIQVQAVPLDMLKAILTPAQWNQLVTTAARGRALLAGRVVWNVNATAHGGGVAELLQSFLAYARGAGVDARWLVLDGDPEFFAITKRVHNALHGSVNGGQGLGASDHEHYERVLEGIWSIWWARFGPATSCFCTTRRQPAWSRVSTSRARR